MEGTKKLVIPFGKNKIVAEIYNNDPNFVPELSVYIEGEECGMQDVCLVRPHSYRDKKSGRAEICGDSVECLVWGNPYFEDYTNKYEIGVYSEPSKEA